MTVEGSITASVSHIEMELQALVDRIANCLVQAQKEVFSGLTPDEQNNLDLLYKWDFDGSCDSTDPSVFLSSLIPLRLINKDPDLKESTVLWQNPRPSSTRTLPTNKIKRFPKGVLEMLLPAREAISKQNNVSDSDRSSSDN
ncbi:hypothetical protein ILUMI_21495 [Ignelater luminosus]|uniref:Uncharacterized protein n=1 Tax=Ignelater luminosus TaxID=2038154 RepID=A0A8K0G3U4_IGNLU|nr:hypothetical protein ILUMI_21495 [Ignelater luminosus]